MSKERDLLEAIDRVAECLPAHLVDALQELLSQPEQFKPDWASYRQGLEDGIEKTETKQAPVAWLLSSKTNMYTELRKTNPEGDMSLYTVTALYASPQTREPLSEATIEHYLERQGADFKWESGFLSGVAWAEKAHGIGE